METSKELLGVARKLSSMAAAIMAAITVLSAYLLQRAGAMSMENPAEHFDSLTNQWGVYRLNFSFRTMTVGWPLLLGLACFGFTIICSRRQQVWAAFKVKALQDALPECIGWMRLMWT